MKSSILGVPVMWLQTQYTTTTIQLQEGVTCSESYNIKNFDETFWQNSWTTLSVIQDHIYTVCPYIHTHQHSSFYIHHQHTHIHTLPYTLKYHHTHIIATPVRGIFLNQQLQMDNNVVACSAKMACTTASKFGNRHPKAYSMSTLSWRDHKCGKGGMHLAKPETN